MSIGKVSNFLRALQRKLSKRQSDSMHFAPDDDTVENANVPPVTDFPNRPSAKAVIDPTKMWDSEAERRKARDAALHE